MLRLIFDKGPFHGRVWVLGIFLDSSDEILLFTFFLFLFLSGVLDGWPTVYDQVPYVYVCCAIFGNDVLGYVQLLSQVNTLEEIVYGKFRQRKEKRSLGSGGEGGGGRSRST